MAFTITHVNITDRMAPPRLLLLLNPHPYGRSHSHSYSSLIPDPLKFYEHKACRNYDAVPGDFCDKCHGGQCFACYTQLLPGAALC